MKNIVYNELLIRGNQVDVGIVKYEQSEPGWGKRSQTAGGRFRYKLRESKILYANLNEETERSSSINRSFHINPGGSCFMKRLCKNLTVSAPTSGIFHCNGISLFWYSFSYPKPRIR